MKWYKILYQFWLSNLERNAKRMSIGFGSFLIVIITTCSLPTPIFLASLYGAGISFGSMVIMSIFGKNGNGIPIIECEPEPILETEPEPILETEPVIELETTNKESEITIP